MQSGACPTRPGSCWLTLPEPRVLVFFSIPRQASAEDREAGLWLGFGAVLVLVVVVVEAAASRCGLEVILGVTTAGEPGPRSTRLSSVASFRN